MAIYPFMAQVDGKQLPIKYHSPLIAKRGHDNPDKNRNSTDVNTNNGNTASLCWKR